MFLCYPAFDYLFFSCWKSVQLNVFITMFSWSTPILHLLRVLGKKKYHAQNTDTVSFLQVRVEKSKCENTTINTAADDSEQSIFYSSAPVVSIMPLVSAPCLVFASLGTGSMLISLSCKSLYMQRFVFCTLTPYCFSLLFKSFLWQHNKELQKSKQELRIIHSHTWDYHQ